MEGRERADGARLAKDSDVGEHIVKDGAEYKGKREW
jgi:hypothetical protein